MKFIKLIALIGGALPFYGYAQCNSLIISKYVEGSSNNKAIEITNSGTEVINLLSYEIQLYGNGSLEKTSSFSFPDTLLASGQSIIVIHPSSTIFTLINPFIFGFSFNGNDALQLFNTENEEVIDVIGVVGENPLLGWDVSNVTNATYNHTLVRKSNVNAGEVDWSISKDTWIVNNQDSISSLGVHTFDVLNDCSIITDLTESVDDEILIYPNLIKGNDLIYIKGIKDISNVKILSVTGDLIGEWKNTKGSFIALSHKVIPGLYLVVLTVPSGQVYKRKLRFE